MSALGGFGGQAGGDRAAPEENEGAWFGMYSARGEVFVHQLIPGLYKIQLINQKLWFGGSAAS